MASVAFAFAFAVLLAAWAPKQTSAAQIRAYTGIRLCPNGTIRDLTSRKERDGLVGLSFRYEIELSEACEKNFRNQLATLPEGQCPVTATTRTCFIQDASAHGRTRKHASVAVEPLGAGRFDIRVWE